MGRRTEWAFFQRENADGHQRHEKMFKIANHQENANQNHNDIISHLLLKWVLLKEITNAGKDVKKMESLYSVGAL